MCLTKRLMGAKKRLILLAIIALIGVALAGCSEDSKPSSPDSLVLYNGQHRSVTDKLVKAFTEETGIEVKIRDGKSERLANQIMEEGERSPADVFFSEESPPMVALDNAGLLAQLPDSVFNNVITNYSADDKNWVGVLARSRVTAFNPEMVDEAELPDSVMDMATKAWEGRVAFVPTSGAFQAQIIAIKDMYGRDAALNWLKGLKKYGEAYSGNMAAMRAVEAGEIATALVNNYYWFIVAREKGPENMVSQLHFSKNGDAGGLLSISTAGILKTSENKEAAQKFIEFMMSEAGQKVLINAVAAYPLRKGVTSPFEGEPYNMLPFDQLEPPPMNPDNIGSGEEALQLRREAGLS